MAYFRCDTACESLKLPDNFQVNGGCSISMQFEPAHNNYLHGGSVISGNGTIEFGDSIYKYQLSGGASAGTNGYSTSSGGSVSVVFTKI